jgi:hypothetical protein
MIKTTVYFLLFLFCLSQPSPAQDNSMFRQKKERKKVWRGWNKKRDAYNPYLKKRAKNKPSAQMARSEKRDLKRQKRDYKRSIKRSKSK